MTTIDIVLKDKKQNGTENVKFRITHNRKVAYISTEYHLLPGQLKNGKVQKHENAALFNNRLREQMTEYERRLDEIALKAHVMTAISIRDYLVADRSTATPMLLECVEKCMDRKMKEYELKKNNDEMASKATFAAYQSLRNRLYKLVAGRRYKENPEEKDYRSVDIPLAMVDFRFLKDFEESMTRDGMENGRWNYMKDLRAVFNNEINEGNITADMYPFRNYNINNLKKQKEPKVLELFEVQKIFRTPVQNRDEEIARKIFMLDYMLLGINPADLYNMGINGTTIQNGRYNFGRSKTSVINSIKIEPESEEIINELMTDAGMYFQKNYSCHNNFSKSTNKFLKRYAKSIEMREFTIGYARYTWATIAYNDLDIEESTIDAALGHKTSRTVAGAYYIKKSRLKVDEANRRMIDLVLKEEGVS